MGGSLMLIMIAFVWLIGVSRIIRQNKGIEVSMLGRYVSVLIVLVNGDLRIINLGPWFGKMSPATVDDVDVQHEVTVVKISLLLVCCVRLLYLLVFSS